MTPMVVKKEGPSKVRLVQLQRNKLWNVFFSITLVVTPVMSNVAGDAIS